jgi:hypothetical protein
MINRAEIEAWLLNPPPGSKAAAARDFGIDLSLTLQNLQLTPQQRLEKLEAKLAFVRRLRASVRQAQLQQ